jgi:type II secretory pathway component PulM
MSGQVPSKVRVGGYCNEGIQMAEKAAKRTKKKHTRVAYTKADVRELRAYSKARTPVKKIAKAMKRTEASLRQKALQLGIGLGHQR